MDKLRRNYRWVAALAALVVLSGISNLDKQAAVLGAARSFAKPYNLKAVVDTVRDYCHPVRPG